MKITQEADYALRIVYFLAQQSENEKFDSHIISEKENIPLRFLYKIMRKLIKAGIIDSIRGINGGFKLSKSTSEINLKDIIEAVDGPIVINKCVVDTTACNLQRTDSCKVHKALKKVQREIAKKLQDISMQDIINDSKYL